jgi:signal peptidase I
MSVMDPALDEYVDEDEEQPKRQHSKELWFLLTVALVLALVMKTFLIQAFFIPSGSMEKTLHGCPGCKGDRVLVNKVVYKFRDIHRGEIVVFNGKGTDFGSEYVPPPRNVAQRLVRQVQGLIGFGGPGDKDFIKRVIGIEGDIVACCTPDGKLTVNGQPLDEPYVHLSDPTSPQDPFDPKTVPEGHLWVMGDHRDGSADSRINGPVPVKNVVGRAFAVFWPYDRTKVLRVPETFQPQAAPAGSEAAPAVLGFAMAVPITVVRRRLRATTD